MSFNVLVSAEDPKHDGLILKPLVSAILVDVGKPRANVGMANRPRTRGYADALRLIRHEFPRRYGHFDLWLFFPDADRASPDAMVRLESDVADLGIPLLCCPAKPEVEIYACVGYRHSMKSTWEEARSHPRMKEEIFQPLLREVSGSRSTRDYRGLQGRARMMQNSLRNLPLLFRLCPELGVLRDRIADQLQGGENA